MSRSRKKRAYQGSRTVDRTCRCHGGCPWCLRDRKHAEEVRREAAQEQVTEFFSLSAAESLPSISPRSISA